MADLEGLVVIVDGERGKAAVFRMSVAVNFQIIRHLSSRLIRVRLFWSDVMRRGVGRESGTNWGR